MSISRHEPGGRLALVVLICSAAILDDHKAALQALDVDQFLSKPYHPAELLGRIAADPELRAELVTKGIERVRGRTLEAESARVARFLADPDGSVPTG